MKRHYIILAILGPLLIIGGVVGLVWNEKVSNLQPTSPAPRAPTLTAEQVISRIQVYALPALIEHGVYGAKNPAGQWAAIYEGGQWRVRGAVVVRTIEWVKDRDSESFLGQHPFGPRPSFRGTYVSREYYYSTTWLYGEDGYIKLLEFSD